MRPPILISGMIAGDPQQGGAAWAVLQYVLGFERLGYDAYLVEPIRPEQLRPAGSTLQQSENAAYFNAVARAFGIEDRACLVLEGTGESAGLPYPEFRARAGRAVAIFNISGMFRAEDLLAKIPVRVYLDLDPAFNQLWHATQGIDMRFAGHNYFVTVGQSLGRPECQVPRCDVQWIPTVQPVVLALCARRRTLHDGLTTVANWRAYGSIEHGGVFYGQKAHSLRPLMDLPTKTREKFFLALSIHPDERKDLAALSGNQWNLLDPRCVADTPQRYLHFISSSKAEFGVAKSGYVVSNCAWFSDRSACYLACGRPVIAQETGFSDYLPCGAGLFRFRTADDVLEAIEAINGDYPRQSDAAFEVAAEYFESGKVLKKLSAAVGVCQ